MKRKAIIKRGVKRASLAAMAAVCLSESVPAHIESETESTHEVQCNWNPFLNLFVG